VRSTTNQDSNEILHNHIANTLDAGPYDVDSQETVMGKGDRYRTSSTTREEQNLRDKYAHGDLTFKQYERAYRKLMKQGLIQRNGRILT